MGYMFPRYFAETLFVPLALGISPFALREERIVNPMDFPCLYRFRKYRLRAVGRYPPVGTLRTLRKPTPLSREMDITPT
jgi:hypothetical protein